MSDKKVEGFYKKYDYMAKAPYFIELEDLTEQQKELLLENKTFCMLPWMHMHAFPDGRAYPCCLADYWHPVGDLRRHTMEEVWNQDAYKTMRKNMIQGKECSQCTKCYEQEANGFFSMRNDANRNYGHHINELEMTDEDGHHGEFKIRYWDVRFSNLCNMRCRSCGPIFSSNWYSDHIKLYDTLPKSPDYVDGIDHKFIDRDMDRVEYTTGNEDEMIAQMEPHLPHLEQVYFAGGEPLIMKEHYYMLEKLVEYGKQDVRIQYNTNFSEMRYKDKHVFEYWKNFNNVSVGASLDASGDRAELMRKGTKWHQTVLNRTQMIKEVPHVDFYISATVSSMNIMHVMDFHKEWVELGLIKPQDFNINICQSPEWYRIDIFPQEFKAKIREKVEAHIAWLEPKDKLKRATNGYKSLLNYLDANDGSNHFQRWIDETQKLDSIRNENFWETFPEFKELR